MLRAVRIPTSRRGDPFADPEALIRRVYTYLAYRIGAGPDAENVTREVFARQLRYQKIARQRDLEARVIEIARRCVDERLAELPTVAFSEATALGNPVAAAVSKLSERDREFVALHHAGLSRREITDVLGFRPDAVEVAHGRALARFLSLLKQVPIAERARWSEPRAEFMEALIKEVRDARPPGRPRRIGLALAAALTLVLLVAGSAFGGLHYATEAVEQAARAAKNLGLTSGDDEPNRTQEPAIERALRQYERAKGKTTRAAGQTSGQQRNEAPEIVRETRATPPREKTEKRVVRRPIFCADLAKRAQALPGHQHQEQTELRVRYAKLQQSLRQERSALLRRQRAELQALGKHQKAERKKFVDQRRLRSHQFEEAARLRVRHFEEQRRRFEEEPRRRRALKARQPRESKALQSHQETERMKLEDHRRSCGRD